MESTRDVLQVKGINEKGYGIIPKLVMQDKRLTVEAKAIYAYFCSYAGVGKTAFPSRDRIISDLGISKSRFYKHFNLLKKYGYIEMQQKKSSSGQFKQNLYVLIQEIPCPQNPYTENPYTENKDTIINNINKINSFKINSEREGMPAPAPNTYGEFQKVRLTNDEYNSLIDRYGQSTTTDYITRLDCHIASKGSKYKSHYATIKKWIDDDGRKQPQQPKSKLQKKGNRFDNFESRDIDFDEIEKKERELLYKRLEGTN